MIKFATACMMILVMTVVLWGQCTDCPLFKSQPKPAHGCCQKKNQTAPPAGDRCADQDQKLQAYQQSEFSKISPAPVTPGSIPALEPAIEVESLAAATESPRSSLYVLNSTLRI